MSTETQKVDVLAVLDDEIESLPKMAEWAGADASIAVERLTAAREALASLFARADDAAGLLESLAPTHARTRKLRAALARVGGAK